MMVTAAFYWSAGLLQSSYFSYVTIIKYALKCKLLCKKDEFILHDCFNLDMIEYRIFTGYLEISKFIIGMVQQYIDDVLINSVSKSGIINVLSMTNVQATTFTTTSSHKF